MSETIGQKLRGSREEKRLSLEQVSAATRVRLHYLEALERDDLSAIPSAAQARGFLRIYADYLGLNADESVPVARPPEPQPIVSSPNVSTPLSTDLPTVPVQETISTSAPARPNLLTSLRERFTHRSNTGSIHTDTSRGDKRSAVPDPEFVPAHYTEELPAEPAPVVIEKSTTEEPTRPVKRSSSKKVTAAKKPALRKAKTFSRAKAENKSEVKKKITPMSRPKRGSSSHKQSSSPTRRVSKKTSNCKPKKRA